MLRPLEISMAMCMAAGLALLASAPAVAQHRHGGAYYRAPHVGVYFGTPLYSPFYYPAPYYGSYYGYPPAAYLPPAAPAVYVERSDVQDAEPTAPQAAPQTSQSAPPPQWYWYYCPDSNAYYPHVKDCTSPWQRVSPRPPSASR